VKALVRQIAEAVIITGSSAPAGFLSPDREADGFAP
jgi:hypothetical protein